MGGIAGGRVGAAGVLDTALEDVAELLGLLTGAQPGGAAQEVDGRLDIGFDTVRQLPVEGDAQVVGRTPVRASVSGCARTNADQMLTYLTTCQVRTSSSTEPPSALTWKSFEAPGIPELRPAPKR
ncbi:hypothetical protein B1H29_04575 [Streptomyces pactum]|uniref:Uncharacterized protein n=1 Tax=Streptomyces pactum TaxID=68249 RepID=A0A1S6J3G4_9ACTN|nr:hypothetical protein B1H29_04575 [Streptomyces pactum]